MTRPETRLFHVHVHVPDVDYAAAVLADYGLPVNARYGSVDGEAVALGPDETPPADFRFRLQDSQRGHANVTLTAGPEVSFDHLGIVTSGFDDVVERARKAGWTVQGVDEPRTFLITPWEFRIEIHPETGRIAETLGSWEACRFGEVTLSHSTPTAVHSGIEAVVGEIPGLHISDQADDGPHLSRAVLVGDDLPEARDLRPEVLAPDTKSGEEAPGTH